MRAIDFGAYTRVSTAQDFENLKPLEVGRAIIGTRGNRRKFMAQAMACIAAGLTVEAYIYVYWNEPAVVQTMNALALIRSVPQIRRVWVDVETDDQNIVYGNPRDTVDTMLSMLKDYETGIYSSREMWAQIMQDSHAYSQLPLWDAAYGAEDGAFVAYGGWLERAMHQYAGSVNIDGLNVDLSSVEERIVYTDQQIDDKLTAIVQKLNEIQTNVANTFALAVRIQGRVDALEAAQPKTGTLAQPGS